MTNPLGFLLGVVWTVVTLALAVHTAENKLFWVDEGYEIVSVLKTSMHDILVGLSGQASANPLYYALQKLNLDSVGQISQDILVRGRLVSIIAACCAVLF